MAIIYGRVDIEGTRPLLWHHFTPEILQSQAGVRVERKGTKGNHPSEWKRTDPVLIDRYLPQESELSHDPGAPVYLDVQMVRNPATRARNVRYRIAASPGSSAGASPCPHGYDAPHRAGSYRCSCP
jgi:hypothetical protein